MLHILRKILLASDLNAKAICMFCLEQYCHAIGSYGKYCSLIGQNWSMLVNDWLT